MNRWITQSVVFGVALSGVAANPFNPLPFLIEPPSVGNDGSLSLSSRSHSDGNYQADQSSFTWRYLNQCADAILDMDSCLVSNAFLALSGMEGYCSGPDFDEEGLRFFEEDLHLVMASVKLQCAASGDFSTDQEYNSALDGIIKIFDSDSCLQKLCEDYSNVAVPLVELYFDEIAKCAGIELDINQCVLYEAIDILFNDNDSSTDSDAERVRRKLSRSADDLDSSSYGYGSQLYRNYENFFSSKLMSSDMNCTATTHEIDNVVSYLAAIFSTQYYSGGTCTSNDYHFGRLNYFDFAIKYTEQCSGVDLNMTSCLTSSTIEWFRSVTNGKPDCIEEMYDNLVLWSDILVEHSKQVCMSKGIVTSDQEFNETVVYSMDFFGAKSCWASLCEEESSPSEMMLQVLVEEIAECADAELDFNPCLLDQIYQIVFFSEDSDETFDWVRRKIESVLNSFRDGDEHIDPCAEQASDAELQFSISLLLAGAEEQCTEMGEVFEADEVDKAESELFKLFGAQHCWGVSHNCNGDQDAHLHGEKHTSYTEFIEESTTWMLGQCVDADVEEISCVFSRSVEVMHGMKRFGWSYDGDDHHSDLAQESASTVICTPPSEEEYDVERIASHAMSHCLEAGAPALDSHYNQTVVDLNYLMLNPDCWETLCEPEVKELIIEEWMQTCASTDLEFLTNHGPHIAGDASLDSDILRCMTDYIASEKGKFDSHWACSLPRLGHNACGSNPTDHGIGKEAYFYCGGEGETFPPSLSPSMHPTAHPSQHPSMHLSMSFAYNDEFAWSQYGPDMSLSMSLYLDDDGVMSMPYDDDHVEHESEISLYIETVCGLISELNVDTAHECLHPVCDIELEDAFPDLPTTSPTYAPSVSPSTSLSPSTSPTLLPSASPSISLSPTETSAPSAVPSISFSPTETCYWIDMIVVFDRWPRETSWDIQRINDTEDDIVLKSFDGAINESGILRKESMCLEEGWHRFTIYDSFGDGITDPGHYNVSSYGELIIQGAGFLYDETVVFSIPFGNHTGYVNDDVVDSIAPSMMPTIATAPPSSVPTQNDMQPTPSPTVQQLGSVEVSFEVGVTLDGIDVSELDPNTLDDVVNLLQSVFGDILPDGAIVRILTVGGFTVTRRLLRFLEENISGVEVKFEVIMMQTCASTKCEDSEADEISLTLYEDVTSNFKANVESGELTTSIQEKAKASRVSEMSDVSISASSLEVSEAKVTVKEASQEKNPVNPPFDDDSASSMRRHGVALSIMVGFVSIFFSSLS